MTTRKMLAKKAAQAKAKKPEAAPSAPKKLKQEPPVKEVVDLGGRPVRGDGKSQPKSFSLTQVEYDDIQTFAKDIGFKGGSDYIRAMHQQMRSPEMLRLANEARRYDMDFKTFAAFLFKYWKDQTKGVIPVAS